MIEHSYSSSSSYRNLRRQPKQQRSKERIAKILAAAAVVFDEVGYEAATTHFIAAKAETAVGSLYQFFPDKAAIFKAMELRHVERVKAMWAQLDIPSMSQLPLRDMIHGLMMAVAQLLEEPVSRVIFVQFYVSREMFQAIDDSMTQEAINFMASILKQRRPTLDKDTLSLVAEVCVHSSNAIILATLRCSNPEHRQRLTQQIEDLMVSYLEPYVGDRQLSDVIKVMICLHCGSSQLTKNGYRRDKQCYRCKACGKQFVVR